MVRERLQKVLARGGVASRRAAEGLIAAGRVRVNGQVIQELGAKANPFADRIEVDGRRVIAELPVYAVLHKPRGVMSTLDDPEGRPTVKDYIAKAPGRVYPIGRLDFATSGVLLLTNDGTFADALLHPRRTVPKTYIVKVHGVMQPPDLERWRKGIELEDGKTAPAQATLLRHEGDKTWFELTITEGRNQQIRRMGDTSGFRVMRLARLSFATITAEGLRPGDWRMLNREELVALKAAYGVPKKIIDPAAAIRSGRAPTQQRSRTPKRSTRGARQEGGDRGFGSREPRRSSPPRMSERSTRGARAERGSGKSHGPNESRGGLHSQTPKRSARGAQPEGGNDRGQSSMELRRGPRRGVDTSKRK